MPSTLPLPITLQLTKKGIYNRAYAYREETILFPPSPPAPEDPRTWQILAFCSYQELDRIAD